MGQAGLLFLASHSLRQALQMRWRHFRITNSRASFRWKQQKHSSFFSSGGAAG